MLCILGIHKKQIYQQLLSYFLVSARYTKSFMFFEDNSRYSQKSNSAYIAEQGGAGDSPHKVQVKTEHCGK